MSKSFKFCICAALVAFTIPALADDIDVRVRSPQTTTPPPNAKFEVMQSTLAARWTFRLDKYTGRVWQLVTTKDGDNGWEEMQVVDAVKLQTSNRPRFQLFTSSIAARHTFLLDTDTGKTWVIVTSKRKSNDGSEYEVTLWEPFASP